MKNTKTRLEWFNELPVEIKVQAIENTKNFYPSADFNSRFKNLGQALAASFPWDTSPQGHDYWRSVVSERLNTQSKCTMSGQRQIMISCEPEEVSLFDWFTPRMILIGVSVWSCAVILVVIALLIFNLINQTK